MEERVEENSEVKKRPVAGMRALALGAFCAFGVFAISIGVGMSSVLSGKKLLLQASESVQLNLTYDNVSPEIAKGCVEKIQKFAEEAHLNGKLHFSLTSEELNSLICFEPQFSSLKGVFSFKMTDNVLTADVSFPLSRLTELKGAGDGKFLNGEATFITFVKKGELRLQLSDFRVKGKTLEIDMLGALRQINLLEYWQKYKQFASKLNLVADIKVEGETLHVMNWFEPPVKK